MAFVVPRKGYKGVYVYYHDPSTGRQKQIPRKLTKHLDKVSPQEIQAWIDQWEKKNSHTKERSVRMNLSESDRLSQQWSEYQSHYQNTHKRREENAKTESGHFFGHIVPFFVGEHERKKPETWHDLVPDFHSHLYAKSLKDQTVRYILWTLKRFGDYLVWSRKMTFPFAIQTPTRNNVRTTPLKTQLTPESVLKYVRGDVFSVYEDEERIGRDLIITPDDIRLSVLLGYFAGLRPSEQWALNREDFLTGDAAEKNTKTLPSLKDAKLGTRLSVVITKAWKKTKPASIEEVPKTHHSYGFVNIWHPEAAKMIAKLLKDRPPGRLFQMGYYGWYQAWRRLVLPKLKVTAHDLRRASGFYLGRIKRLDLTLLQEHMRHSQIETTMLYIRDPEVREVDRSKLKQDFDDIL